MRTTVNLPPDNFLSFPRTNNSCGDLARTTFHHSPVVVCARKWCAARAWNLLFSLLVRTLAADIAVATWRGRRGRRLRASAHAGLSGRARKEPKARKEGTPCAPVLGFFFTYGVDSFMGRKGFSKYSFMMEEEREYIVKLIEKGHTDREIAEKVHWPLNEVRDTRCEFFPTAGLAKYFLKANALKLAQRIVTDCNVEEAVDILSRPNIGVLAPAVKNAPGPMKAQFMTSINPADLGGVKVAAQLSVGESEPEVIESVVEPELRIPRSIEERMEAACKPPAISPSKDPPARKPRSRGRPKSIPPSGVTPEVPAS